MKVLASLFLEIYWTLLRITVRTQIRGLEAVDSEVSKGLVPVFAVAHHTILLSVLAYMRRPATLLASLSKDGELAAVFLKRRGFELVRGSSSRGGQQALRDLKFALQDGKPVAVTFDGPRGPRFVPKPGIGVCAWNASGSIYLLKHKVKPSRFFPAGLCLRLKSWDRFVVPLPYCRLESEFFRLDVPLKATQTKEEWVASVLSEIELRTKEFYQPEPSHQ